jgi:hypothetical protein
MHPARKIAIEAFAARVVLNAVAETLADDDQAKMDTIEGETNLLEALDHAILRIREMTAHRAAINGMIETLKARKERFDASEEYLRGVIHRMMDESGVIHRMMDEIGQTKIERPIATLSLRVSPTKVEIIDAAQVPELYLHPPKPREPDKNAIKAALKDGLVVPGAILSSGGQSLQIR